jgi:hypothetical protein
MTPLSVALAKESRYIQDVVPRILPILVVHAQSSKTLTYKELSLQIDEFHRVRHLDKPLDVVGNFVRDNSTEARRAPPLEAIVVKSSPSGLPGSGIDYLLEDFLKKTGVISSRGELANNRRDMIKFVHNEIFSFPWHQFFDLADLSNSATRSQRRKRTYASIDPGTSGTHARSAGSFEGRHNPVVLALQGRLPSGWSLASGMKSKCDLAVKRVKSRTHIFEVKCGTSSQELYSALGGLIFHTEANKPAKGILVIPGNFDLPEDWIKIFTKHQFSIVEYLSKESGFEFRNLEVALAA